ncbi:helix-turn-helix transcriptional regulator [Streptomyces nodosus]|uniref:DNA-binding protein n=1 Tax=Streptomyces nodosus TaxID=40318 RepID=A0A0B5D9A5_9ACTN|nr:helix-turn-helix transcriptional regulator [Streptomyces nodosus]AJE40133.1 DNA-binding protein [Streptomyces nodosus]MBB4791141.1 transcriptional regulator with XRE-family HTH domain [Streptomyces nodosus]QEV38711.1 XRE family transcriptional regulator [Streptomyces nodosus]
MSANFGERLREVRKRRGLSQRELSELSGVSLSLIRKLEQGERDDTRLETARRLANVLKVPTTRLITEHAEAAADEETVHRWAPVHAALAAPPDLDGLSEEPTYDGVRDALEAAVPLFARDRFVELVAVLPPLLRDAEVLTETDPRGRPLRARLLELTGWLMTQTRQFDAADLALERALDDAVDRVQGAATVSVQCWLLLRRGRLAEARALAVEWADEVEPRMSRATPTELSAWGWLLLRVSAAAIRDNRPGEAGDALRLARSAAVALGEECTPEGDFLRTFGPVTVALKRTENAMVAGRPDEVLSLAAKIPADSLKPTSNNRNRHLLDVADAQTQLRQYAEAVDTFNKIRAGSPQWLPNQRYARDILVRIVSRRRTLTPEMRELADLVHLPV